MALEFPLIEGEGEKNPRLNAGVGSEISLISKKCPREIRDAKELILVNRRS